MGVTAKTVEQARRAQDAGADYLGSGAVFSGGALPLPSADGSPTFIPPINWNCLK